MLFSCVLILCCSIFRYGCMFAFVVCFRFSVLSQEIGQEERLQNDIFCVGWDVKPQVNQSVPDWSQCFVFPSVL